MGNTVRVAETFGTVLIVVVAVAVVVAVLSVTMGSSPYERIGKGGLSLDEPTRTSGPLPGSAAARAEASEEIRQLVEAKSARRVARGEAPLDVEAEVETLTRPAAPAHDDALREEVRQLVVARNVRRAARGREPLDVEAEVERQLRAL